jgi:hypothetical protein
MRKSILLSAVLLASMPVAGTAQEIEAPSRNTEPLVFLDCQRMARLHCDFDHVRREITWLNWVRDRREADVHLLLTAKTTSGGGFKYTLDFIGLREFAGRSDTLQYVSDPDDTSAEIREDITRMIALGIVPYITSTAIARQLRISHEAAPQHAAQVGQQDDPWNLWVFRISADGSRNGESLQRGQSLGASASANRTSEQFKFDWHASGRSSRDEFDIDDETVESSIRSYGTYLLGVWSLGEQWSAGGVAGANHSSFNNIDLSVIGGPVLEYNIFPYHESTRKSVTFQYSVEVVSNKYKEITVTGETRETLSRHRVVILAEVQQPWGEVFGLLGGTQYFHDTATHRADSIAGASFRIFRGFQVDISASFSRIKDQFSLSAEGATPEEILLRRRERETDSRFRLSMGFSYRFGSKFANIVNPRMRRATSFFF